MSRAYQPSCARLSRVLVAHVKDGPKRYSGWVSHGEEGDWTDIVLSHSSYVFMPAVKIAGRMWWFWRILKLLRCNDSLQCTILSVYGEATGPLLWATISTNSIIAMIRLCSQKPAWTTENLWKSNDITEFVTYLLDGRFQQNTRSSDHNGLQQNVRDLLVCDIFIVDKYSEKRKRFSVARLVLWTHYCCVAQCYYQKSWLI